MSKCRSPTGKEELSSLPWLPCFSVCSQCLQPALTEGKHGFHGLPHVCPWQVPFSAGRAGWQCGGTSHNSGWHIFHLAVCAHIGKAQTSYPLQGVVGLCLMGPGFCLSFLRPLHASQTLCRLREEKKKFRRTKRQTAVAAPKLQQRACH